MTGMCGDFQRWSGQFRERGGISYAESLLRGYGLAVMTNAMSGQAIIDEIRERVERVYEWDSRDEPLPRT